MDDDEVVRLGRCVARVTDPDWPTAKVPHYILCGNERARGWELLAVPLCARRLDQVREATS